MKNILLTYTSPSYPPEGIETHRGYEFGIDNNGSYVSNCGDVFYFDYEVIKQLFSPFGMTWDEVDKEKY